jgi:hypothetical protein
MLRHLFTILLLASFSAQTFQQALILLDYTVNTSAFAKNCENKERPVLKCKGKCQMMKKIQEEEEKNQQNPERKLENKSEVVLSSKSFYPVFTSTSSIVHTPYFIFDDKEEIKRPRSVFHPPLS